MKKVLALLLSCAVLLTGCTTHETTETPSESSIVITEIQTAIEQETTYLSNTETTATSIQTTTEPSSFPEHPLLSVDTTSEEYINSLGFSSLKDDSLQKYVEDTIYADLIAQLDSDEYFVENVEATYISKDYIEAVAYNSQENIYFGYKLSELDALFQGQKYIFTLGDDGKTEVKLFEEYDDTFDEVVRNVAIGTGVILICVTVSVVTAGAGAPAISMVFAASAKSATIFALSSGVLSGVSAGVVKGIETGSFDEALKEAALKGSEGYMWGAIAGAVDGGFAEYRKLKMEKSMLEYANLARDFPNESISFDYFNDIPKGYYPNTSEIPTFLETPTEFTPINIPENIELSSWQLSEKRAEYLFGGKSQVSFLNGEIVAPNIKGTSKPDIVRKIGNQIEAIEVKNYDLKNSLNPLINKLSEQVGNRVNNLPEGYKQRIVLDVTDRGYTKEFVIECIDAIRNSLMDIYPNIPINIIGI